MLEAREGMKAWSVFFFFSFLFFFGIFYSLFYVFQILFCLNMEVMVRICADG